MSAPFLHRLQRRTSQTYSFVFPYHLSSKQSVPLHLSILISSELDITPLLPTVFGSDKRLDLSLGGNSGLESRDRSQWSMTPLHGRHT